MNNSFSVDQKLLLGLLSSMQPICTKRTTLDATSSILFQVGHKELILKSTDLEISLQSSCTLESSSLDESKQFLVSGRRIFDIVKEIEGTIEFVLTENQLSLKAGAVNLALNIKDAQEFPPFPERIENMMQLDAPFLINMVNSVSFLIPQNNANPALNGLFLEINKDGLKMTSTDGHCLAQARSDNYNLDADHKWLLPRKAVLEIKKIIESCDDKTIFLGTCGNQLVFSGQRFNFFTKLLVDAFPQYQTIMDKKAFIPATVDRAPFVKALRRSACLLSGQFIATTFDFSNDRVNVSMQNKEVGKLDEQLSLYEFDGGELDIRFYAPYLLSGLQVFPDDKVKFFLKNSSKPIIFETKKDECSLTYLVMPVSPTHTAQ